MKDPMTSVVEDRSAGTGLIGKPQLNKDGMCFTFAARTANMPNEHMLKAGWFDQHVSFCDEPAAIGGGDEYPPPLGYLAMALGWCALTQFSRIAEVREIPIDDVQADVEMDWWTKGSLRDGTAETGCKGVRVRFTVTSPADEHVIAELVDQAERGCYVENLVKAEVSIASTFTQGISADSPSQPS